jgi:hypothetical protein
MNTMILMSSKSDRRFPAERMLLAGLLAAALCGCARYDITETNGIKLVNVKWPVRSADGTYYTVHLADGQTIKFPSSRLISVVPHGESNSVSRN